MFHTQEKKKRLPCPRYIKKQKTTFQNLVLNSWQCKTIFRKHTHNKTETAAVVIMEVGCLSNPKPGVYLDGEIVV